MKAFIASVAAVAALSAALPAAAQSWGRFAPSQSSAGARLEQRIESGVRSGAITPSEARSLDSRLRSVRELEWRYGRDGYISPSEARDLDRRYAELSARIRSERMDRQRDYRGYGYGYGHDERGYDRDYRYDRDYGYRR